MELGNMVFGNSRGAFEADRDRFQAIFGQLIWLLDSIYEPFENEVFEIFPYYWGDCTCDSEEYGGEHTDKCLLLKPNFFYKPTGFSIQWYKYPFRDSYTNMDLNDEELTRIALHCVHSLLDRK